MLIGIVSDSHGLLRPSVLEQLQGVDHILHGGDVGPESILADLRKIAPVTVVRGNVDREPWCSRIRTYELIEFEQVKVWMIHDLAQLDLMPESAGISLVVYGHSHAPSCEVKNGVTYLNPGSIGPRRFSLPISMARMKVSGAHYEIELIKLME